MTADENTSSNASVIASIEPGQLSSMDIGVGIVYVASSIVLVVPYVFALLGICRDADLVKIPCYKILIANGLMDMVMVIVVCFMGGIISLTGSTGGLYINKFAGALAMAAWFASSTIACLLSINRFIVIYSQSLAFELFGGRKVLLWIGACYLYGCCGFVLYMLPGIDCVYQPTLYLWYYTYPLPMLAVRINQVNDTIIIIVVTILYCGVAYMLKSQRKQASHESMAKHEKRAMVPAFLLAISLTVLCLYFFIAPVLSSSIWIMVTCNLLWCYAVGINGIVITTFNNTVQRQVLKLLGLEKYNNGRIHNVSFKASPSGGQIKISVGKETV